MGNPAATATSQVIATDTHMVLIPTPGGPMPAALPHVFTGQIVSATASTVLIGGKPAATLGSVALNAPPHLPTPPGAMFQSPPSNQGSVAAASATVMIGGKGAARVGDTVSTCNFPTDLPVGTVVTGEWTVMIG